MKPAIIRRLAHHRRRNGFTKALIEEAVGVPPHTLVSWELGNTEPTDTQLRAWMGAYGFTHVEARAGRMCLVGESGGVGLSFTLYGEGRHNTTIKPGDPCVAQGHQWLEPKTVVLAPPEPTKAPKEPEAPEPSPEPYKLPSLRYTLVDRPLRQCKPKPFGEIPSVGYAIVERPLRKPRPPKQPKPPKAVVPPVRPKPVVAKDPNRPRPWGDYDFGASAVTRPAVSAVFNTHTLVERPLRQCKPKPTQKS